MAALRARGVAVFVSDCPTLGEEEDGGGDGGGGRGGDGGFGGGRGGYGGGSNGGKLQPSEGVGTRAAEQGEALPIAALDFAASTADARPGGPGGPQPGGGVALAFGNERRGCSRALVAAGDGTFFLPMSGFTQSFNIGVAVAMSLAAAINSGAFPMGTLSEDERAEPARPLADQRHEGGALAAPPGGARVRRLLRGAACRPGPLRAWSREVEEASGQTMQDPPPPPPAPPADYAVQRVYQLYCTDYIHDETCTRR